MSGFILVVPVLFSYISKLEFYSNVRTVIYMNLARTVILEAVMLVIVVAKYIKVPGEEEGVENFACWENSIGQEMYRFLVWFLFILVLLPFLIESLHKILYSK